MSRNLNCYKCNKVLGIIRDGSISKGINCICSTCMNIDNKPPKRKAPSNKSKFGSIFGDNFGEIFGNKGSFDDYE